jgi:hypothetical protein
VGVIPWYEREEGLETVYRGRTLSPLSLLNDRPVVWRTFTSQEDIQAGINRGRIVCFGFHPFFFEEDKVQSAMTLAVHWLVTGSDF